MLRADADLARSEGCVLPYHMAALGSGSIAAFPSLLHLLDILTSGFRDTTVLLSSLKDLTLITCIPDTFFASSSHHQTVAKSIVL